jgi:hypothetical protein
MDAENIRNLQLLFRGQGIPTAHLIGDTSGERKNYSSMHFETQLCKERRDQLQAPASLPRVNGYILVE